MVRSFLDKKRERKWVKIKNKKPSLSSNTLKLLN
jgi:hypothetical protein